MTDSLGLDWEAVYAGRPRWDIGRPQPAFLALARSGAITGRVLDVGCGTGEHVLMCFSGPDAATRARHLTREDITACFAQGWRVDSVEATVLDSRTDEDGIPAWLVALTRSTTVS